MQFADLKEFIAAILTFFRNAYQAIAVGKGLAGEVKDKATALIKK